MPRSISSWLLDPQTPHDAVLRHVGKRWAQLERSEFELAVGLRRLFLDQVHRGRSCSSFRAFVEAEFGMPGKLAELFSFIGRNLERLPLTRVAFEAGEISYTKVREFVRIATVEDEVEWIEFAASHTNRELERKVRRATKGTEEDLTKQVSELTPEEVQATRKAREMVMKDRDEPVPPAKLLGILATEAVEGGGLFGNGARGKPAKRPRPYLAIHLCPECLQSWSPAPGENLRLPIERWLEELKKGTEPIDFLADLLCDCEGDRHRRDRCPNRKPTTGEPPKSRHVPAAVLRRVEARDGFRCRVPSCQVPVPLETGHVRPFRDGTPMDPAFLGQQCATCNDLIETGRLRVEGEAPFERYYGADGKFLGFGFDPVPAAARKTSHVGKNGDFRRGDAGGPEPGVKRRA